MEIIGRFIMMVLLMSAACVAGALLSACVYLVLRLKKKKCGRATLMAGLFPPATMAFWLACLVVSSALSGFISSPDLIFGDINEALPNGYRLKALDKMPEAGNIEKSGDLAHGVGWVRSLQVEGPYVFGQYDYTYFPRTPKEAGRDYFIFDTRSGHTTDFSTESQLAATAKTKIHLTSTESFRGPERITQHVSTAVFLIVTLASPSAVGLWLLFRLMIIFRGAQDPRAAAG